MRCVALDASMVTYRVLDAVNVSRCICIHVMYTAGGTDSVYSLCSFVIFFSCSIQDKQLQLVKKHLVFFQVFIYFHVISLLHALQVLSVIYFD